MPRITDIIAKTLGGEVVQRLRPGPESVTRACKEAAREMSGPARSRGDRTPAGAAALGWARRSANPAATPISRVAPGPS